MHYTWGFFYYLLFGFRLQLRNYIKKCISSIYYDFFQVYKLDEDDLDKLSSCTLNYHYGKIVQQICLHNFDITIQSQTKVYCFSFILWMMAPLVFEFFIDLWNPWVLCMQCQYKKMPRNLYFSFHIFFLNLIKSLLFFTDFERKKMSVISK